MKTFCFRWLAFFSPLLFFVLIGLEQGRAEEVTTCTTCAVERAAQNQQQQKIIEAESDIQTNKNNLKDRFDDMESAETIDETFLTNLENLVTEANCTPPEDFDETQTPFEGVSGHLYETSFYCPDITSFEDLTQELHKNIADWSSSFDPQNTAIWEEIVIDMEALEQEFDDYFLLLIEYEQILADMQSCTEAMITLQENGECLETQIEYEETEIPNEFDDPADCPNCNMHLQMAEAYEADLADIQQNIEEKNRLIADLSNQLSENESLKAELSALISAANCDTDQSFEEIEIETNQATGIIYEQVYFCQN